MESIAKTGPEKKVLALCERALEPLGFRIVDLDVHLSGRSLVRIFIEPTELNPSRDEAGSTPSQGKKSTSIHDCVKATQVLGPALEQGEAEPLFPGGYDLEVSSPGLDRRLRVKSDFEKHLGEQVKLKLTESLIGHGANLTGALSRITPSMDPENGPSIVIQVKGRGSCNDDVEVPITKIKRANLVWQAP